MTKYFKIQSSTLDDDLVCSLICNKHFFLDMTNVQTIKSSKFIELFNLNIFKLFNVNSDVLTYLSLVSKNGKLNSYMNFNDLIYQKRELIRRHFKVL